MNNPLRFPLVAIATMVFMTSFSQSGDNQVVDGQIVYQHVFDGSIENPLEFFENLPFVDNVRDLGGSFFADVTFSRAEMQSAKRESGVKSPPIFMRFIPNAQVQIQFREGRSRVTVSSIILTDDTDSSRTPPVLETYCIKRNGDVKPLFNKVKPFYDALFTSKFQISNSIDVNDDW